MSKTVGVSAELGRCRNCATKAEFSLSRDFARKKLELRKELELLPRFFDREKVIFTSFVWLGEDRICQDHSAVAELVLTLFLGLVLVTGSGKESISLRNCRLIYPDLGESEMFRWSLDLLGLQHPHFRDRVGSRIVLSFARSFSVALTSGKRGLRRVRAESTQ